MSRLDEILARLQPLLAAVDLANQPVNPEAPTTRIEISNAAAGKPRSATIYLYDLISSWWGISPADFVRQLVALDVEHIDLHIHSPGGDAFGGLAMMTALRQHPATVTAWVDGLAASAASYVALGADEVVMARNAELMIHDASGGCYGQATDMTKMAEILDKLSANVADVYAQKAGGTVEDWRAAMLEETWYTAQEALDTGLIDRIDGADAAPAEPAATASTAAKVFDLAGFRHQGRQAAPSPWQTLHQPLAASAAQVPPPAAVAASGDTTQEGAADVFTPTQLTNLRKKLGVADDADADTILAALDETLDEQATITAAPAGTVLVDQAAHQQLQADAAAGRAARDQQLTDRRLGLVDAAMRDGRIPAARRDHWVAALAVDPEGNEAALAALTPGLIPLEEIGHATAAGAKSQADLDYEALFGPDGN